jgi:hypothetical protein
LEECADWAVDEELDKLVGGVVLGATEVYVVCVKFDIVSVVGGFGWRMVPWAESESEVEAERMMATGGGRRPVSMVDRVQVVGWWLKIHALGGGQVIAMLECKIGRCCAKAGS